MTSEELRREISDIESRVDSAADSIRDAETSLKVAKKECSLTVAALSALRSQLAKEEIAALKAANQTT